MNGELAIGLYIEDMLESVQRIEQYSDGVTVDMFSVDVQLQDAVVRRLEIMGEASKHVPQAVRAQHPEIPWREIAGMRDVLIHSYSNVNIARVWQVITTELPAVKPQLLQLLAELNEAEQRHSS